MFLLVAWIVAFFTLSAEAGMNRSSAALPPPTTQAGFVQQKTTLPPIGTPIPVMIEEEAIPEQSAADLKQLAETSDLTAKAELNEDKPVVDVKTPSDFTEVEDKYVSDKNTKTVLKKEDELKRLDSLPPYNLRTNKAPLADVLTLLATTCQMSYIGLEKGLAEDIQISVNINKNPYDTLKYLADRYNIAVDYDTGIWKFAIFNDDELIARIYHLRYNDQEEVSGGGGSGGGSSSSSSSSGSSSSGGTSTNVGASASSNFSKKSDAIQKNIETFLGFSSADASVLMAEDFDVDKMTQVTQRGVQRILPKADDAAGSKSTGKVIYHSDTRSLYVMATRAQHQWIEKYLATVDKPMKQILVEAKIYETGVNPKQALGINLAQKDGSKLSFGSGTFKVSSLPGLPSGSNSAILNWDELQATINLLDQDSSSTSVQYPQQVTISNRPVSLASVQQIPIQQSSTSTTTGTGGNTTNQTQVQQVTVGINISVLPRIIESNRIQMDISITSSSVDRYVTIDGNPYPVINEREYKTQAIIDNGYTLAIGGLKGLSNSENYTGVPVLSKVPFFGALFRNRSKDRSDSNLMIFISPTILDEYRGGVKEDPQFITPRDKDTPRRRAFEGSPDESYTDIMLALGGMDSEVQKFAQTAKEGLRPKELANKIAERQNELRLMNVRLREIALEQPNKDVSQATKQIDQYLKDLHELRRTIRKNNSIIE